MRRDEDPDGSSLVNLAGFVGATATAAAASEPDWYQFYGHEGPGGEDDGGNEEDDGSPEDLE